ARALPILPGFRSCLCPAWDGIKTPYLSPVLLVVGHNASSDPPITASCANDQQSLPNSRCGAEEFPLRRVSYLLLPKCLAASRVDRQQAGVRCATEQTSIGKGYAAINLKDIFLFRLVNITPAQRTVRCIDRQGVV